MSADTKNEIENSDDFSSIFIIDSGSCRSTRCGSSEALSERSERVRRYCAILDERKSLHPPFFHSTGFDVSSLSARRRSWCARDGMSADEYAVGLRKTRRKQIRLRRRIKFEKKSGRNGRGVISRYRHRPRCSVRSLVLSLLHFLKNEELTKGNVDS